MYQDFDEACEATVTRQEAINEINKHKADLQEFFNKVGNKDLYKGSEVLFWLGY